MSKEQDWVDQFVERYNKAGWQTRVIRPATDSTFNTQNPDREEKTVAIHLDFGRKQLTVYSGIVD